MHASSMKSFIALAALFSRTVSANPVIPRRPEGNCILYLAGGINLTIPVTESPLDPWVSVDASGSPVATITPILTTINGDATTISANPGATTSSTLGDSKPTTTSSGAETTSTGGGSFPVCHNMDGDFAPFCLPSNGSSVYVGETYYGKLQSTAFRVMSNNNSDLGYQLLRRKERDHPYPSQLR